MSNEYSSTNMRVRQWLKNTCQNPLKLAIVCTCLPLAKAYNASRSWAGQLLRYELTFLWHTLANDSCIADYVEWAESYDSKVQCCNRTNTLISQLTNLLCVGLGTVTSLYSPYSPLGLSFLLRQDLGSHACRRIDYNGLRPSRPRQPTHQNPTLHRGLQMGKSLGLRSCGMAPDACSASAFHGRIEDNHYQGQSKEGRKEGCKKRSEERV